MTADDLTLLTVREIAARERISIDTVKKALRNQRLRGHKVGDRGDWRVTITDYHNWLAAGAPTAPTKPAAKPQE